ncbi:MAG: hypothetical protein HY020_06985 [Burkholderiales bacterium]|nr:hypothetical protein [Burkholderiales bacterium]
MELRDQHSIHHQEGLLVDGLREPLAKLLSNAPDKKPVDVVLESAWLPLMLLDLSPGFWSDAKLRALLSHNLGEVYDQLYGRTEDWDMQFDYHPGDSRAVGYGLAREVRESIAETAATAGQNLASIQPAFQWAARRLKRPDGWWAWIEQDRALLSRIANGRTVSLNAAAPLPLDEADSMRLIRIEARRHGDAAPPSAVTAGWCAPWTAVVT